VKRRRFISAAALISLWPRPAWPQQAGRTYRVGVLMPWSKDDPENQPRAQTLEAALQEHGWIKGRNLHIEFRWAAGDGGKADTFAQELIDAAPDVLLATATQTLAPLQKKSRTIPIVFLNITDPLGQGFVSSLSKPGGNITGFSNYEFSMASKWLELLGEIAPALTRVAVMQRPGHPAWAGWIGVIEASAAPQNIQVVPIREIGKAEIEATLNAFARERNGGLIVLPDPALSIHRDLIVSLAARHRIPAVYPHSLWTTAGGLLTYGTDIANLFRQAAGYIDLILRGANPGDLPVQQPTKFELTVNLKAARDLALTVPQSLLARADEVIE
jgi:putative ABC transport system substrate-binding protein